MRPQMRIMSDIPKHKKKKKSSTSKSKNKAKHAHQYKDCLIFENNKPHKATYCTICGKLGDVKMFDTEPCGTGYRMLSAQEILEKYPHIPQFMVNSIWDKFISLTDTNKSH